MDDLHTVRTHIQLLTDNSRQTGHDPLPHLIAWAVEDNAVISGELQKGVGNKTARFGHDRQRFIRKTKE